MPSIDLSATVARLKPAHWFIATVVLAALCWSGTIRSDAVPHGDGSRIMKWLSFVQTHQGWPLWNPYRNGGYPLFADAEQFWFLVPFVNSASAYANLQLNLALFFCLLLLVPPAWLFARRLGLSPPWAAAATILVVFNENTVLMEQSARFQGLLTIASFAWALAIVAKPRLNIIDLTCLVVSTGAALALALQYALPHALVVWSALVCEARNRHGSAAQAFAWGTARALLIGVASVALAAVIILPVFGHVSEAHLPQGLTYEPLVLGGSWQLGRLIFPSLPAFAVFQSFLLLPALALAIVVGVPRRASRMLGRLRFLLAFLALFAAMLLPIIGPKLASIYSGLPIISTYRQFFSVAAALAFIAPPICMAVLQKHRATLVAKLDWTVRLPIAAYLGTSAMFILLFADPALRPFEWIVAAGLMVLALYIFTAPLLGSGKNRFLSIGQFGTSLIALSLLLVLPSAFREKSPYTGKKLHVSNAVEQPEVRTTLETDKDTYFNVLKPISTVVWTLHSSYRMGVGFSLYFPRSFAYTLGYYSTRFDIDKQRPHWTGIVQCSDLDPRAVLLLGVRYLLCKSDEVGDAEKLGFKVVDEVVSDGGLVLLRRSDGLDSTLPRVFCRWRALPDLGPKASRAGALAAFEQREVVVEKTTTQATSDLQGGRFDDGCPDSQFAEATVSVVEDHPTSQTFRVDSKQAGLFVIPENLHSGWTATVNGAEQPIEKVFHAYRGISVERGSSIVQLRFSDRYVSMGLIVSGLTALLLLLTAMASWLSRSGVWHRWRRVGA